jgi:hypothetical protein
MLGINGRGENVRQPTLIGKKWRAVFEEGLFSLYFKMRALSRVMEYGHKLCSLQIPGRCRLCVWRLVCWGTQ